MNTRTHIFAIEASVARLARVPAIRSGMSCEHGSRPAVTGEPLT